MIRSFNILVKNLIELSLILNPVIVFQFQLNQST